MKKYALILCLVLLVPAVASAGITQQFMKIAKSRVVSGGTCDTSQDSLSGTTAANIQVGQYNNSNQYIAGRFQASYTYTMCKAVLRMTAVGSPTQSYKVAIYTDVTGGTPDPHPGTQIGTASDAVDASTVGSTEQDVTFSNMSASIQSGNYYWIVCFETAGTDHASDYLTWARGAYNASKYVDKSGDASTWNLTSNGNMLFTGYK